jgi:hypothetical protein
VAEMNWDRRIYPRYETDIPVELTTAQGDVIAARMLDISLGGMMIGCDLRTAHEILPEDQRTPGQVVFVEVDVRCLLPRDPPQAGAGFEAHCKVAYSRRLAQNDFNIGLSYAGMSEDDQTRLERYIEARRTASYPMPGGT